MSTETSIAPGPLSHYRKQAKFCWKKMKHFIEDPELLQIKMTVWQTLEKDPVFKRPVELLSTEEMKRRTAIQLNKYCQYNFLAPETANFPYKRKTRFMMTVNEALAVTYPDVSVKHAIGIGLFKNTLTTLGTERHKHILDAAWNNKVLACLALTEVSHGSNTKQMRTSATFDKERQEFVINTPDFESAKCWVGNLGKSCTMAILFAQLHTNGQCHGLHAFIVPIRDPKTLIPYPGITVGDMGEKIGLHGIDNGFILFNNYRIPRENLLNKTADVTPEGDYESSFSDPGRILGAALENLSTGRVGIMQESSNNLICAVTIALRYAAIRKQFAPNGDGSLNKNELPLIEYQLHQWRLFPHLSAATVLRIFVNCFTEDYLSVVEQTTSSDKIQDLSDMVSEIHSLVSSAKPLITWSCRDAVQECREACGGHGFLKASRLGDIRSINDPCVTYEGDNNVLVQQSSNWLLRQWQSLKQDNILSTPLGSCDFLKNHERINKKFGFTSPTQLLSVEAISQLYEYLIIHLIKETEAKQLEVLSKTKCKFTARCETQVYHAAVLSRAYIEYNALKYFWKHISKSHQSLRETLNNLGFLYGLNCLEKHLLYFYQGGYATGPELATFVRENILSLCAKLKPDALGVVDALAPPDFVVDSVLGKSDGKLYENLQNLFFHNPGAMSRPAWWSEIIIPNAPDFKQVKSKL
ncbi:unnamed protein product [Brassicogethes aeneus]|uniref:Acyl-coenzyme A oxidase n=1 Tax=Brassicogethes aeneus TaxID=1431903 RepID=A0A9P0B3B6_BRAAE|nr:unnamed protein product [Brassicogethes aeneus]